MQQKIKPASEGTNAGAISDSNNFQTMDKVTDYHVDIQPGTDLNKKKAGQPDAAAKPEKAAGKSDSGAKIVLVESWLNERYKFRYNVIKNAVEYRPIKGNAPFKDLDERGARAMEAELLRAGFNSVRSLLEVIFANTDDFDPFGEYIKSLTKWDGKTDHIERLAGFVKVPADRRQWFNLMFKKHLVRSLACALGHIPFNKQCIVFVSGQDDGKTTFFRKLCPPALDEYYTEDIDFENKDGLVTLARNLWINLDELRNLSRQDINKVKSFLTKDSIKARLPFDRRETKLKRRASFVGSTNNAEFLVDETGNVRWLVFEINGIEHDNGGPKGYGAQVDINDVYAQANALLESGFPYMLTREEIGQSESFNQAHTKKSLEYELILKHFEPSNDPKDFNTASDIKRRLEIVSGHKVGPVETIGRALKQMGIERKPKKVMGQVLYGYLLKGTGEKDWSALPDDGDAAEIDDEKIPF